MPRASPQSALRAPLSRLVGSQANVRVLRELSRHGGQLSAPRLTAQTGLAHRSVYLALSELQAMKIVDVRGSGSTWLYQFEHHHPLAGFLSALFEAEERRFDDILECIETAAKACNKGVIAVWLHGSVARGDDQPTSDLDIAVVTTPGARSRIDNAIREQLRTAEGRLLFTASLMMIGTDDLLRLARERAPWWKGVLKDGRPIVGDRPEALLKHLRISSAAKQKV